MKYGIHEEDIYNFDETGFQMGVITTAKVITGSEQGNRPVTIQLGNREWVTVIECISSYGWALPPMIYSKARYISLHGIQTRYPTVGLLELVIMGGRITP